MDLDAIDRVLLDEEGRGPSDEGRGHARAREEGEVPVLLGRVAGEDVRAGGDEVGHMLHIGMPPSDRRSGSSGSRVCLDILLLGFSRDHALQRRGKIEALHEPLDGMCLEVEV